MQSANLLVFLGAAAAAAAHSHEHLHGQGQAPLSSNEEVLNGISTSTRNYWMGRANRALFDVHDTPCPFQAFGSVIVNHTAGGIGELVCIGANNISASGNPTIHGEVAAINNCSSILTDPNGPYKLTGAETMAAWADLTLYTNAEPCPMCASAIRWAGFKELIFGSSTDDLMGRGWPLFPLPAKELFTYTWPLETETDLLGGVFSDETDVFFSWQYTDGYACPKGCARHGEDKGCEKMWDTAC